jgi:hypothetical protein
MTELKSNKDCIFYKCYFCGYGIKQSERARYHWDDGERKCIIAVHTTGRCQKALAEWARNKSYLMVLA